ncbi:hypothetical protein [Lysobacter xanthus]
MNDKNVRSRSRTAMAVVATVGVLVGFAADRLLVNADRGTQLSASEMLTPSGADVEAAIAAADAAERAGAYRIPKQALTEAEANADAANKAAETLKARAAIN